MRRELVGGNDELGVALAAHAVDGAGGASANGVGVAPGKFGSDGDGTISAAHDGALVIEGVGAAEVNDEAGVLRGAGESDGGADLNAEGFVGLGVGNAGRSGGIGPLAALDVDGAGRGSGAASVSLRTDTGGIGSRADVTLNFLLSILANDEVGQEKRKDKQATENCKIAVNLHWTPHAEAK